LNSGDSFVLVDAESVAVWHGKLCSDDERAFAVKMADKLAEGKPVTEIEEGNEEDSFWEKLGGKEDYPTVGDISPPEAPPRLFQINDSVTGGKGISVSEILEFDQEDLDEDDVMLLDTNTEVSLPNESSVWQWDLGVHVDWAAIEGKREEGGDCLGE